MGEWLEHVPQSICSIKRWRKTILVTKIHKVRQNDVWPQRYRCRSELRENELPSSAKVPGLFRLWTYGRTGSDRHLTHVAITSRKEWVLQDFEALQQKQKLIMAPSAKASLLFRLPPHCKQHNIRVHRDLHIHAVQETPVKTDCLLPSWEVRCTFDCFLSRCFWSSFKYSAV